MDLMASSSNNEERKRIEGSAMKPIGHLLWGLLAFWIWYGLTVRSSVETIPYSEFRIKLRNGAIESCTVEEDGIHVQFKKQEVSGLHSSLDSTPTNLGDRTLY